MIPTAYFKTHNLYNKMTQVLADNNGTVLLKTSFLTANTDTLVTADPANVHHVLNSHYSIYQRGSEFRKTFGFLSDAVFIKDLDEWRQGKKFTHSFYKETQFHNSTPKIIRQTLEKALVPVLDHASRHNQPLDLQTLFHRYMLDATCILATGFDPGSLRVGFPKTPLLEAMDDISEAVYSRLILPESVWKVQRFLGVGKEKKLAEAVRVLYRTLHGYVSRKYDDYQDQESEEGFDVLKFYIANINEKSTEYLVFNLMTLLFAGRDTSAALLTWFFHLVSTNPTVEENIMQEIRREFHNPRLFYEAEELSKLVYLQGALTESLRLFPTAPVIIRDPIREDMLPSGHRVGTKTKVVLCTYAMGRMGEIWGGDWAEFKPERWLSEKGGEMKRVASNSFLAFGSGPWACPGKEVAMTRMKGVVATIMHNYRVDVWEGQSVSPGASAILTMRHGLKATISNRWV